MANIQSVTFGEARRYIETNLGIGILGTVTSGDTTSVLDTNNLWGNDDEHNNKQIRIYETTDGENPQGDTRIVTDYDGGDQDLTVATLSAAAGAGDKYELLDTPWKITEIDNAIKQVLQRMTPICPQIKDDLTIFTERDKRLYPIPSGFVSLAKVYYCASVGVSEEINRCETAWTAGTNATVTLETEIEREGSACQKIVIADAASTTEIIAYGAFDAVDISNCDTIEIPMYSTVALTAGQLQYHLAADAAIATALESLDIPAMSANKWYTHSIALANPISDTAIISDGLYQVADVGACTVFIDKIRAVNSATKRWVTIPKGEGWNIERGSTDYINLTMLPGANKQLWIKGYQNLTVPTSDSTALPIEPWWVINMATADLLANHSNPLRIDIENR